MGALIFDCEQLAINVADEYFGFADYNGAGLARSGFFQCNEFTRTGLSQFSLCPSPSM